MVVTRIGVLGVTAPGGAALRQLVTDIVTTLPLVMEVKIVQIWELI
jgi:hypothetical protein